MLYKAAAFKALPIDEHYSALDEARGSSGIPDNAGSNGKFDHAGTCDESDKPCSSVAAHNHGFVSQRSNCCMDLGCCRLTYCDEQEALLTYLLQELGPKMFSTLRGQLGCRQLQCRDQGKRYQHEN